MGWKDFKATVKGEVKRATRATKETFGGKPGFVDEITELEGQKNVKDSYLSKVEDTMAKGEIKEEIYNDLKRRYQAELQTINESLERLYKEQNALKTTLESEIERFEAEKTIISSSSDELTEMYSKALIPEPEYKKQKKELDAKLKSVEAEIEKRKKALGHLSSSQ